MAKENFATGIWNSIKDTYGKANKGYVAAAIGASTGAIAGGVYGGSGKDGSMEGTAIGVLGGAITGAATGLGLKHGLSKLKKAGVVADDIAAGTKNTSESGAAVTNPHTSSPKTSNSGAVSTKEDMAQKEGLMAQAKKLQDELNEMSKNKDRGRFNLDDMLRRIDENNPHLANENNEELERWMKEANEANRIKEEAENLRVTGPTRPVRGNTTNRDMDFRPAKTGTSGNPSAFEEIQAERYNHTEEVENQKIRYNGAKRRALSGKKQNGLDGEFIGKNDLSPKGSDERMRENYKNFTRYISKDHSPKGDHYVGQMHPYDRMQYENNVEPGKIKQVKGGHRVSSDPYSTNTDYKARMDTFDGGPETPSVELSNLLDNKRSHKSFELWTRFRKDYLKRNNMNEYTTGENTGGKLYEYDRMVDSYRIRRELERQEAEFASNQTRAKNDAAAYRSKKVDYSNNRTKKNKVLADK